MKILGFSLTTQHFSIQKHVLSISNFHKKSYTTIVELDFVDIIKALNDKYDALFKTSKCKAVLSSQGGGRFKKESRMLIKLVQSGVPKAIMDTKDLKFCKKQQINKLVREEKLLFNEAAAFIDALALVLRGDGEKSTGILDLKTAYSTYSRGEEYFNKGKYIEAIREFDESIQLNPEFSLALKKRGNCLFERCRFDEAISDYTTALELDSQDSFLYTDRAQAYWEKGIFREAIVDCTRALNLNPVDDFAYCIRAEAYRETRMFDLSILDCKKAIELNRDNPWAVEIMEKSQTLNAKPMQLIEWKRLAFGQMVGKQKKEKI
jgi:tetratricopeptide (TPR) repeat protein